VHQTPQLHYVVLERCSRQEQSSPRVEAEHGLPPLTLEVLNVLSLVENHVVPFFPSERKVVLDDQLVGCDTNVEGVVFAPAMSLDLPFFLGSEVRENFEARTPPFELHFPVHDDGGWHNN